MDLIKHAPGIVLNGRENSLHRKMDQLKTEDNKSLTKFYNNEFRKWHIKLILIIVSIFGALYFIAFNLPFSN